MEVIINPIKPLPHHNYVAFFLTLNCNLKCSYCINLHEEKSRKGMVNRSSMSGGDWVKAANRLDLRDDLPLTFQGGEPTLHKDFYQITNEVKSEIKMDLLTNMMFNVDDFVKNVPVERFTREAPYASIRVSYHPGQNNIEELIKKTKIMEDNGFKVGLYSVLVPDGDMRKHIEEIKNKCVKLGIDFRTKEFLGNWKGKLYGTFKYKDSIEGQSFKNCKCKTSEIIVDPEGNVYKCHADLYHKRNPIAHILDNHFNENTIEIFRDCAYYGNCNPCDVKVKTNRFQIFGHTSVEIKDIES